MTSIETWVQSSFAVGIAKTLLHSLWQAALVALILAAALRFIPTARIRYAAACGALLLIVAISVVTFFQIAPSSEGVQLQRIFYPRFAFVNPDAGDNLLRNSSRSAFQQVLPWLTPIWLIGVLLFNLRQVVSWVASHRMRTRGVCAADDTWQRRLEIICGRLNLNRPVVLLESCLAPVPLVVGHLRPMILMPLGLLAGLTTEQVELILMHELAHILRRDYLINVFQTLVEGAMFYNPAVWWVSKMIRVEREHCCDDIVVNTTRNAYAYATTLAALEENRSSRPQPAVAATGGNLVNRIRRVLNQPEPALFPFAPVFAAVVVILVITGLLIARPQLASKTEATTFAKPTEAPIAQKIAPSRTRSIASAPAKQNPGLFPAQPLAPAYKSWIEQDVAYIIRNDERAAFLSLRTDEERDAFIKQFWLRRDPTPGTPENEFKDEHYRRIAYANDQFAARVPASFGWKTDRGRIYIMYGRPDEIESHPSGGIYDRPIAQGGGTTSTFPFEVWRYQFIEGIGNEVLLEFVDSKGTGEYPQTIDPRAKDALRNR